MIRWHGQPLGPIGRRFRHLTPYHCTGCGRTVEILMDRPLPDDLCPLLHTHVWRRIVTQGRQPIAA